MSSLLPSPKKNNHKLIANSFIKKEKLKLEIKRNEDELDKMQQISVPENDDENDIKFKKLLLGIKKFNIDPNKGIEYLIDHLEIENTSDAIAKFIYSYNGVLNKFAIGEYFGENNDFNIQVLNKFLQLQDFKNKSFIESLREFLQTFCLPGEGQKIDRMMNSFAQHYCKSNPNVFQNSEACYVLSYAIMMLNTSLHNPSVPKKQTVDEFVNMCRDSMENEFNEQMLKDIFNNVQNEPFKMPIDEEKDIIEILLKPLKEGWLWKQGGKFKLWKRRWFVLINGCLYYFEYQTEKELCGIVPLENVNVRETTSRTKEHCFEIYSTASNDNIKTCKLNSVGEMIEGNHTVFRMSSDTDLNKNEWIKCLKECINQN